MRILLTGTSSMTGVRFAKCLAETGHDVIATFSRKNVESYVEPMRQRRVAIALNYVTPIFDCRFGDPLFVEVISRKRVSVLCHHGADVINYKSPEFDVNAALGKNTYRLKDVLRALRENDGGVVLTGSVFEGKEGAGSGGLPHFSPYGLSKSLTSEIFRFYCTREEVPLRKFVIPNPFGPYEEPRFTEFLVRSWFTGQVPVVKTPAYVRDNIHVTLLAKAYGQFVGYDWQEKGYLQLNPSGYVESQGAFAERFARELEPRIGVSCPVELAIQTEFTEPRIRINTDQLQIDDLNWDEAAAWDELAKFYLATIGARG